MMVSGANGAGPHHIAILRNLFASSNGRNPYLQRVDDVVVANNITYNAGFSNFIYNNYSTIAASFVNNATIGTTIWDRPKTEFMTLWNEAGGFYDNGTGSEIYIVGNRAGEYLDTNGTIQWNEIQASVSDRDGVDERFYSTYPLDQDIYVLTAPIEISGASFLGSDVLVTSVASTIGARANDRDTVDTRIVSGLQGLSADPTFIPDTINYSDADCVAENDPVNCCDAGTGQGHCNRNAEAGWPALDENGPTALAIPSSPHVDAGDGYTNLEVYLQGLADVVEGTATPTYPIQGAAGNFKLN